MFVCENVFVCECLWAGLWEVCFCWCLVFAVSFSLSILLYHSLSLSPSLSLSLFVVCVYMCLFLCLGFVWNWHLNYLHRFQLLVKQIQCVVATLRRLLRQYLIWGTVQWTIFTRHPKIWTQFQLTLRIQRETSRDSGAQSKSCAREQRLEIYVLQIGLCVQALSF